jgi:O-antigen/teichoic acid export membrane protein
MGSAVRPVFFHLISKRKIEDIETQLTSLINSIAKLALPVMAVTFVYTSELIRIFFGEKWVSMTFIFRMLHFPAFFLLLVNWLDRAFDVLDAQFELFRLEIIFVIISLSIIAIDFTLLNKNENILIVSLTTSSVIYYCLWIWRLFYRAKYKMPNYFKLIFTWILTAILWYLFVVFLKKNMSNNLIVFPSVMVAIGIYYLFDKDIKDNFKRLIK